MRYFFLVRMMKRTVLSGDVLCMLCEVSEDAVEGGG